MTQENLLIKALHVVLQDESFKIKTPVTIKAREAAEKLDHFWMHSELAQSLQKVIHASAKNPLVLTRRSYGSLTTQTVFFLFHWVRKKRVWPNGQ